LQGLHMRAAFFRCIRKFFHNEDFLEVDTPLRQPVYIPESTIIPVGSDGLYLQTSPELCMKRLLAAGCINIFQICHCFRKEERGRLHLEEFQMLEWYRSGADYFQLMADCEHLLRYVLVELQAAQSEQNLEPKQKLFKGINLQGKWQKLKVQDAFKQFSPVSLNRALTEDCFDEILVEYIEPFLGVDSPLFLYDYPVELASLARKKEGEETIAERFELYIKGVELANGFSELTDAVEQRMRFQTEIDEIQENYGHRLSMPEKFLSDIDRLGSAAGIALGLDRLFMLAMDYPSLAAAVTFAEVDF